MSRVPATIILIDADSPRWVGIKARDAGRLLTDWHIPAVRSPRLGAMVVRRHHVPDLLALADVHGFRVVDRRGEVA